MRRLSNPRRKKQKHRQRAPSTKLKKANLLKSLGDGSIHLACTDAWKQVQGVVDRLERERLILLNGPAAKYLAERKAKQLAKEQLAQATREKQEAEKRAPKTKKEKNQYIEYCYPRVHRHLMMRLEFLQTTKKRLGNVCLMCTAEETPAIWTCRGCDIGFCTECFEKANSIELDATQTKELLHKAKNFDWRVRKDETKKETRRREMEEEDLKWNEHKQFQPSIIKRLKHNRTTDGSNMKGFTVWSGEGEEEDHEEDDDNEEPELPTMKCDSTWVSMEDANERARFLYLFRNHWGFDEKSGIYDGEGVYETTTDGMKTFKVCPAGNGSWNAGVLPDVAFKCLPQGTMPDEYEASDGE